MRVQDAGRLGKQLRVSGEKFIVVAVTLILLGGISLALTLWLAPIVRNLCNRQQLVDHADGERKLHLTAVPRVGGVAMIVSYVAALSVLAMVGSSHPLLNKALPLALAVLPGVLVIFAGGLFDDLLNLSPRKKLGIQLLGGILLFAADVRLHAVAGVTLPDWLSLVVSVGWLVGLTNAFNLIDGMDGLAGGISVVGCVAVLFVGLLTSNYLLVVLAVPLIGALLGFLRYNFHPASLFMGDCGSQTVGFLLGCLGLVWADGATDVDGLVPPLLAFGLPLIDLGVAIIRRFLRGKSIFAGDRRHIHHRIQDLGLSTRQTVLVMYLVSAIGGAFALDVFFMPMKWLAVSIVIFITMLGIRALGYVEFRVALDVLLGPSGRKVIDWRTHAAALKVSLAGTQTVEEFWSVLTKESPALGLCPTRMKLGGQIYEYRPCERDSDFEIRVRLGEDEYVNLRQLSSNTPLPICVSSYVALVREQLEERLVPDRILPVSLVTHSASFRTMAAENGPVTGRS